MPPLTDLSGDAVCSAARVAGSLETGRLNSASVSTAGQKSSLQKPTDFLKLQQGLFSPCTGKAPEAYAFRLRVMFVQRIVVILPAYRKCFILRVSGSL